MAVEQISQYDTLFHVKNGCPVTLRHNEIRKTVDGLSFLLWYNLKKESFLRDYQDSHHVIFRDLILLEAWDKRTTDTYAI